MRLFGIKRVLATVLLGFTVLGGSALVSSTPAHATDWSLDQGSWLNPQTHSRASCAGGGITVGMVSNDPYRTVRTEYLMRRNGSQFAYTGRAVSATSNGAEYFVNYNGTWLASTAYPLSLLYPGPGYYRVYETVSRNGVVLGQGWFLGYLVNVWSADAPWCAWRV